MKSKSSFLNTLPFHIFFAIFGLSVALLFALTMIYPYLDTCFCAELDDQEFSDYENKISTLITNDHLNQILSGNKISVEGFENQQLILIDEDGKIFGAKHNEHAFIREFIYYHPLESKPFRKNLYNVQIVGGFSVDFATNIEKQITPYKLYFITRVKPQEKMLSYIFTHPRLVILILMLISVPLLCWYSFNITTPLKNLQIAANTVTLTNFNPDPKLETKGIIELRRVGKSFNHMISSLKSHISNQQSLLSSISHELRTPLTRLQLALALLRRRVGENAEIIRIEKEANRLNEMIQELLLLSSQKLNCHVNHEIFPITEIWGDIIKDAKFESEQRHLIFNVKQFIGKPQERHIKGNKVLLRRAVENIVRNAMKYAKSEVQMSIFMKDKYFCITIDDNGMGVPDDEYENIFKPFYRIDEARTRETGGVGLGLSIVENVIKAHFGHVWAMQSPLGGLRLTICLPLWITI